MYRHALQTFGEDLQDVWRWFTCEHLTNTMVLPKSNTWKLLSVPRSYKIQQTINIYSWTGLSVILKTVFLLFWMLTSVYEVFCLQKVRKYSDLTQAVHFRLNMSPNNCDRLAQWQKNNSRTWNHVCGVLSMFLHPFCITRWDFVALWALEILKMWHIDTEKWKMKENFSSNKRILWTAPNHSVVCFLRSQSREVVFLVVVEVRVSWY